jgi:UDP-sulfoquinovose synthase
MKAAHPMRVLIAGCDGYLGWSLAQHLVSRGHEVAGADGFFRREWVAESGSWSAIPVYAIEERRAAFREFAARDLPFWAGDLRDYSLVDRIFREFQPEAVVQLAECPSAPYSMIDRDHAVFVQTNNLTTTFNLLFAANALCPDVHLLKLGTMGEYGTPNVPIPEGFFEIDYRGRRDRLPFPRQAGSWYHWSKVHGSNNLMFACKIWGLRATDVMQGVVFGTRFDGQGDDPRLGGRLDFDPCFGTVVNRFCCQAVIGHPITPYGSGGQRRGFLPLRDSMQCLRLALENPPEAGEYRVLNQFENIYGIGDLARRVRDAGRALGLDARIQHVENPRLESEEHFYSADHQKLFDLGYRPGKDLDAEIRAMLADLMEHRDRIEARREVLMPEVRWDGGRRKVEFLGLTHAAD